MAERRYGIWPPLDFIFVGRGRRIVFSESTTALSLSFIDHPTHKNGRVVDGRADHPLENPDNFDRSPSPIGNAYPTRLSIRKNFKWKMVATEPAPYLLIYRTDEKYRHRNRYIEF